ncbi:hypothetical protein Sjap_020767 [Stephania japonica]|uniref:Peptidase M48 domain-containing protein n=1 Tax=Stephania japonica TaxID=461633 RepID=A0AAP0HVV6_9MAGN
MNCYKKAKLAINSFRNFASKIKSNATTSSRSPIVQNPSHRFNQCNETSSRVSGFIGSSSIAFSTKRFQIGGIEGHCKRNYYVDRYQVRHFKTRGVRRWIQNPRNAVIVVVVGSGVAISLYFGNLETVPYTKRTHFVLLPINVEKQLGELEFERVKAAFKGKILPPLHPQSVRVRLIAKDIIEALERGLVKDNVWSEVEYGREAAEYGEGVKDTLMALSGAVGESKLDLDGDWHKEDEVLDEKWVQKSRERGQARGSQAATKHLEGLNWEVVVVDEPVVNAFCLPGGKIVVFTGLLKHFHTDAEIATIIGHEVGHTVARHSAEGITRNMWFTIFQLILLQFVFMPDLINMMSHLLLSLPFSRRMEMEADYIGLLLMASAGCDPRVAPHVYEKLGKLTGDSALRDYLSTHPSGKKRAQLLAEAKVMQEALNIYREVRAGRGIHGFL